MPQQLTYPGVYIEEIPSGVRTISGVATSIAAFVGWACCATSAAHRPTRHIGVLFCEECDALCDEQEPCWCCRESHRG